MSQVSGNYFKSYIQPHLYVIGAAAVGTYFLTPLIGPSVQPIFSFANLSPAITNAVLAGVWAGAGVAALQAQGYSV
jgi:hypothetical protein